MKMKIAIRSVYLLILIIFIGLIMAAQPASAGTCIQDVYQAPHTGLKTNTQKLTCTANDVRIANASNIRDLNGNTIDTCNDGQTFSFIADFTVVLTAQTRYDIGLYFATDGDPNGNGALTGECDANIITSLHGEQGVTPELGSANFINLDATTQLGDLCGDIIGPENSTYNPQIVTVRVDNVLCKASPNTDPPVLALPNCTSWRQPGSNELCLAAFDAFPGSPSKCNCDSLFTIPVRIETATISVTKDSSPASWPEPGGEFTYTVGVTNTSEFTTVVLDRICDDQFGQIVKVATAPDCPAGQYGSINNTDCAVPQTLTAPYVGEPQYSCTFTADVTGEPIQLTDKVTVYGHTDPNNKPVQDDDSAQVSISDVPPTAQVIKSLDSLQCAIVRYGVEVKNLDEAESITLTELTDSTFGSITSVHDDVVDTTCSVSQTLTKYDGISGGTDEYTCTFDAKFCASSHTDQVTGTLKDNENNETKPASNSLTVNVSASLPQP
jgi:hypothetical protein